MRSRRRSLLYLPGSNKRFIDKSKTTASDAIIIDLEDSVSPDQKEVARENAVRAIEEFRREGIRKEIVVRINAFSSALAYEDLNALMATPPDTIIVPKAEKNSMLAADMYLCAHASSIMLIGLIESAKSLVEMEETIPVTTHLSGFQFGSEDYTRDMEVQRFEDNREVLYAKGKMSVLCRAYGLDAIDTPYTDIHNEEGLRKEIGQTRMLGFTGKTAIHPAQIDVINRGFAPSQEEVEKAEKIVEAFELALKKGKGSISFEGKMIDAPIVERAKKILEYSKYNAI